MKLSALIAEVGDENVKMQNLEASMTAAKQKKQGTEISFMTQEITATDIMLNRAGKMALVVWLPKDKVAEVMAKVID